MEKPFGADATGTNLSRLIKGQQFGDELKGVQVRREKHATVPWTGVSHRIVADR